MPTIKGCVEWDQNGRVKFIQESTVESGVYCNYYGCIEWTGIHAGQVKVIIDTEFCDDTYYGCVDWSTGQFEIEIPECCDDYDEGEGDECTHCGTTPQYIAIQLSGVTSCDGCFNFGAWSWYWEGVDVNGIYLLTQDDSDPCLWEGEFSKNATMTSYSDHDCVTESASWTYDTMKISLSRNAVDASLAEINLCRTIGGLCDITVFGANSYTPTGCIFGSVSNPISECDEPSDILYEGGTAKVF